MRRKKAETIFELAVARVGLRKGMQVLTFIVAWQLAATNGGQEPLREISIHEYYAWWKESRATAYRELQRFREAFPTETTPHRFVEHIGAASAQTARAPKWAFS